MNRIKCSKMINSKNEICFCLLNNHNTYIGDWNVSGYDKDKGKIKCFLTFQKSENGIY